MMPRLSVNVDHVATLRQARGVTYPDPVEAARRALAAGASGITVHLRGDRRHIQEDDVARLRALVVTKLNLEMAPTDEMVSLATDLRPHQVTLVPERPEEVTTEGGLDLERQGRRALDAAAALHSAGIRVSLFLDPQPHQIERLVELDHGCVAGFEINTDAYSRAAPEDRAAALLPVREAARGGRNHGFEVYAGHGLTVDNVGAIAATDGVEELNIGHAICARAILIGMEAAVREMLAAMQAAGPSR